MSALRISRVRLEGSGTGAEAAALPFQVDAKLAPKRAVISAEDKGVAVGS